MAQVSEKQLENFKKLYRTSKEENASTDKLADIFMATYTKDDIEHMTVGIQEIYKVLSENAALVHDKEIIDFAGDLGNKLMSRLKAEKEE